MTADRTAWLEERRTYIGGSDIGAILGLWQHDELPPEKKRTPLQVYMQKIGDLPVEIEENESMYWGTLHEPTIAQEYAKVTGNSIEIQEGLIRHPKYPFMAANIDRWVNDRTFILEVKTGSEFEKEWGLAGTDEMPRAYKCQVAWYCSICDVPKVDIAVLRNGNRFFIYTYNRNKDFEEKLIKIGYNFWNRHVIPRVPLPPMNNKDVFLLHPVSKDIPIEANDNIMQIAENLRRIKEQQAKLEKERTSLSFEVQKYMENHNVLLDDMGNALITWNNTKKGNRTFLIK